LSARHICTPLQPAPLASRSGLVYAGAPRRTRAGFINYLLGKWLVEPFGWRLMGAITNRFRRETLGLPPQTFRESQRRLRRVLVVQGFSPHVVPHPADWPANVHTAGFWFLDEAKTWQPPPALQAFLSAGPAPVYIGFGSMTGPYPLRLTGTIVNAVAQSGRRAILQSGWAGMGGTTLPSSMFLLDLAPHRWLFARVSAVVHHGGAGTTAEGLRAGAPTLIIPHMADQPFWGARVAALGAGPRPIPRNKLTAENLASAIRQVTGDPGLRERAAALGVKLRAEDGIGRAIELIEEYLAGGIAPGQRPSRNGINGPPKRRPPRFFMPRPRLPAHQRGVSRPCSVTGFRNRLLILPMASLTITGERRRP